MGGEVGLGERGRHVELAAETHRGRDVGEELLDVATPIAAQHRVAVGVGEREVAHWREQRRGRWRRRAASSASSASSTRDAHKPAGAVGVVVDERGSSTTAALTSSTVPESGAIRSETALTDSTSP